MIRPQLIIILLCALSSRSFAIDREAWSFTRYDINVTLTPAKSALAAEGRITVRNDSSRPQRDLVLQVSSSLQWDQIVLGDKPVQWLTQPYESDVDHTGRVSEAIVTLPAPVPPQGSVELTVSYGGEITRDATRLQRIGMPEKIALGTDWDQIGEQFTAVRGIGYVAWYPVAVNAVSMSEGNTVFDAIARWQERSRECVMTVHFNRIANGSVVSNGPRTQNAISFSDLTRTVPTFAVGEFEVLDRPALTIYYLPQHSSISRDWALAIEKIAPTISQWFGPPKKKVTVIDLADETASAFGSGAELFVPLRSSTPEAVQQQIAPTLTHAAVVSHRRWIDEGLAQFAQMLAVENTSGQKAALAQLRRFGDALAQAEEPQPRGESAEAPRPTEPQPLITTADPAFYRIKATFVWWMLRDMLGEEPLQHALSSYRAADDKEPSYMQRILELEAKHSLEQFFDDWVYRDRGLPDFKIESVYPRQTLAGSYVATVTVVNAGQAGAEVPVRVRAAQGERTARLLVPAGQKATVRVELAAYPTEVVVNDGSVPESDASNNSLTVPPQTK